MWIRIVGRAEMSEPYKLHNGDSLPFLQSLQGGSVDAVITDPPYSSGGAFRGDRTQKANTKYLGTYGDLPEQMVDFSGDNRDQRSWTFWCTAWLSEVFRVLKPAGLCIVFTDWRQLPSLTDAYQAAGLVWRGVGVWDKTWASSRPMAGRFMHQSEYFVWGSKGALPFDFSADCLPGVFSMPPPKMTDRDHPTEKPVDLIKQFLRITGEVVCDPFMGSGTTGAACLSLGKSFIGCEIDPHYFATAEKRLKEIEQQPALFHARPTKRALDGGDSAPQLALSTPEVLSPSRATRHPARRK